MTELDAGPARRWPWWAAALAVATAVAVGIVVVSVVTGGDDSSRSAPPAMTGDRDWQWVSFRDVEVRAPADWTYAYDAGRPDCIDDPADPDDPWATDVPRSPYVTVGTPARPVPAIGCFRKPKPSDPPRAFGAVPFALWQPYVKLDLARNDFDDPARRDGHWEHRGWHLSRTTIDNVQVTVLSPPDDPTLGGAVTASVRHVRTTTLGCETQSPAQAERFAEPSGPAIPTPRDVGAVATCEYVRTPGTAGLEASRRISGAAARDLVAAIRSAPAGGGPDQPRNCTSTMYGDYALALRFFGTEEETTTPLAEAFVYYDWCFGNGIVDPTHRYRLTRDDCAPLFAAPPIGFWGGTARLFAACSDRP